MARIVVAVTPAKNEAATIGRCVQSVLQQTMPVVLHVIVDDYSEDETARIVQSFSDRRVRLVSPNLQRANKQHGIRPHLIQQIGISTATELVPNWDYALLVDGDCWIPRNYLAVALEEMKRNPRLVMVGARYLRTPSTLEEAPLGHVRSANHVIERGFFDDCIRHEKDYGTPHGEILLERYALLRALEVYSLPNLTAHCGRVTGVTASSPFIHGQHDYQLGTPIFAFLIRMRSPSRHIFWEILGWLLAWFRQDKRYFDEAEVSSIAHRYATHYLRLRRRQEIWK